MQMNLSKRKVQQSLYRLCVNCCVILLEDTDIIKKLAQISNYTDQVY